MKYSIRQPQSFSEIGRKDNQEDFLWPSPSSVTTAQRIFVMCDGVGGQESGEVASMTAGTALGNYLTDHWPSDGVVSSSLFEEALEHAYNALDDADTSDSVRKMATTMTCVVMHRGGVLVAHIGDSRIYLVRPSLVSPDHEKDAIIYMSSDHSLVNDLLRIGELTEDEARNFPQKNIITRAMQPHGERRCRADIYNLTDVQTGDYLFLCSDGVLEQLTDERLCTIMADTTPDTEKIATILSICEGRTRDNHTCWLVPIDEVVYEPGDAERCVAILPKPHHAVPRQALQPAGAEGTIQGTVEAIPVQPTQTPRHRRNASGEAPTVDLRSPGRYDIPKPAVRKSRKPLFIIAAVVLIAIIAGVATYLITRDTGTTPAPKSSTEQKKDDTKANATKPGHDDDEDDSDDDFYQEFAGNSHEDSNPYSENGTRVKEELHDTPSKTAVEESHGATSSRMSIEFSSLLHDNKR